MKRSLCPNCKNDIEIKTYGFGTLTKLCIECPHCGRRFKTKVEHNSFLNATIAVIVTQFGIHIQSYYNIKWYYFALIYMVVILSIISLIDRFKPNNILLEILDE